MERVEVIISGRVQMVMYRDFAMRKARGFGLVGEVKNLSDGTVRVIAEGERIALEAFIGKLHEGPIFSRVDHVAVEWKPATGEYRSFVISYL